MIRSFVVVLFSALAILLVLPWLMLWTLLAGNANFMYGVAMRFVSVAVRAAGIRFRVEGLENIPARACVFASNHASNADPPVLVLAIPRRVSILVKRELFRVPILSVAMRQADFVPVDRGAKGASASVDAAVGLLERGLSFLIFAEGTRSPDGRLRPFKKGAFLTAIQARVPVVPVAISGTPGVMKKGEWRLHPGRVTVRFGTAVDASLYTVDRRSELLTCVESLVAAALPPAQQPLAPTEDDSSPPPSDPS
jgi:1-acyl-sn-glycerol-3-phosphate acyltransferase